MAPTRSDCCSHDTSRGPPWISSTTMCAFVYLATPCTTASQAHPPAQEVPALFTCSHRPHHAARSARWCYQSSMPPCHTTYNSGNHGGNQGATHAVSAAPSPGPPVRPAAAGARGPASPPLKQKIASGVEGCTGRCLLQQGWAAEYHSRTVLLASPGSPAEMCTRLARVAAAWAWSSTGTTAPPGLGSTSRSGLGDHWRSGH